MKRVLLLIALAMGSLIVFAQKPNKNEVKKLQNFLQQTSAKGDANYQRLGIASLNSPETWTGVVWSNGRVVSIDWKDKDLSGNLDVDGFTALRSMDCSRNKIKQVNVSNCTIILL
ncbi:MAG: hypothetical protein ACLTID_09870 [Barnesiella sp.]